MAAHELDLLRNRRSVSAESLSDRAERLKRKSKAENTLRAYAFDVKHFAWLCNYMGVNPLPADPRTICDYIAWMAEEGGYAVSTIERRLCAITELHKAQRLPIPTYDVEVKQAMAGIRRSFKCTQEGKKPIRIWHLRRMMELIPDDTLTGLRDRAILLLGFAKGARRSELASLTVESIEFVDEGLVITMTQSKTNQTGEIERYGIAYGQNPRTCPVVATKRWLEASQITTGPLFRPIGRYGNIRNRPLTGHSIALIVKRYAAMIGLDATDFSGHSLRSGFVNGSRVERG